jgi:outer membrane lipoprotein SlyB
MKKLILAILFALPISSFGASMNNDDVIKMVKSGLSEAVVLQSIDAAEPAFDTSPNGLVKLKQSGVSDKVIDRIMARSGAAKTATTTTPTTAAKTTAAVTCKECGTITEIADKKKKGSASGLGAVAGGVVGGVVGNQVVGGTGGTLVGAAGGAVAGHMIEKKAKEGRYWEVTVKFDDGTVKRYALDSHPSWKKGMRVKVVDGKITAL